MLDRTIDPATLSADLMREALLYAAGELDAGNDFENRLAHDSAAQDALIDAVQLEALLSGKRTMPDAACRTLVRDKCRLTCPPSVCSGRWRRVTIALTATILLMIAPNVPSVPSDTEAIAGSADSLSGAGGGITLVRLVADDSRTDDDDDDDMLETALEWAELSNCGDHLQRAVDDEARRRIRQRERQHIQHVPAAWNSVLVQPAAPD